MREIWQFLHVDVIDNFLLLLWRIWFARNEVTHDKPLPTIEGSKRFLCSYLNTIRNTKKLPTEEVIKGKNVLEHGRPANMLATYSRVLDYKHRYANLETS